MANTEIFLRNIFGTTRPNIRPLVLALNITNDLLFEQHISMSDIKATKHIYPDVGKKNTKIFFGIWILGTEITDSKSNIAVPAFLLPI